MPAKVRIVIPGIISALCMISLMGCMTMGPGHPRDRGGRTRGPSDSAGAPGVSRVLDDLRRGDAAAAREVAQDLVLGDPRSSRAHLLLAASYHLAGDPASLDLALSGYGAARQFAGERSWIPLLAGMAALSRSQPHQAMEHFASAALADPDHALAFEGLASAAWATGQIELAQTAAERARRLNAGSEIGWRIETLSAAARGDSPRLNALLTQTPGPLSSIERQWVAQRSQTLLRTSAIDQRVARVSTDIQVPDTAEGETGVPPPVSAPNQMTVDVTLILIDDRQTRAVGVNLLDGLQGIFSLGRSASESQANDGPYSSLTTITRAIRTPDINYNLNIFNRGSRYYEVIARPSLTAFTGQQSRFFIGEQLNVQVSGVNSASLETINVGVALEITPNEIRQDGAQFRVVADRSFFSDQGFGTFVQGVAVFKQNVAATADVRFGETLILSGLSESVTDGQESRTPVLGDIPGPNLLFSRKTQVRRSRSVLVLVTPSLPVGFARAGDTSPAVKQLIELWDQVIEPHQGLEPLVERIRRSPKFTRAAAADVAMRELRDPSVLVPFLASMRTGQD